MKVVKEIYPNKFPIKCYRIIEYMPDILVDENKNCSYGDVFRAYDNSWNWGGAPEVSWIVKDEALSGKVPYSERVSYKELKKEEDELAKGDPGFNPAYPYLGHGRAYPGKDIDIGYVFSFKNKYEAAEICMTANRRNKKVSGVPQYLKLYECEISGDDNKCWECGEEGRAARYISDSVTYIGEVPESYMKSVGDMLAPLEPVPENPFGIFMPSIGDVLNYI